MKNHLRELRAEHNWSQADLADRLGVSRQTVNAVEVGKSEPSLSLAFKIAQLFGSSIETIFFSKEKSMFAKLFDGFTEDNFLKRFIQKILPTRFTQKAVQVITLAQQESRRLGHSYVGTEQILLGLIAEGTGVAARTLSDQGINLQDARKEVEKVIGRGPKLARIEIPFTPRVQTVLQLSLEAARQFDHNYIDLGPIRSIDTEHLLLGLIQEGEGLGARILKANFRVDLQNLEQQILEQLPEAVRESNASSERSLPNRFSRNFDGAADCSDQPPDFTFGVTSARLCASLLAWVEPRQLGYVVISRSGFQLPNGGILAPHIAFIAQEHLKRVPRIYPEVVPDLVVEIKSAFDRLAPLQDKVQLCLERGTKIGLLVDPDKRTVTVSRLAPERAVVLENEDILTASELFPGWELPVSNLWPSLLD